MNFVFVFGVRVRLRVEGVGFVAWRCWDLGFRGLLA